MFQRLNLLNKKKSFKEEFRSQLRLAIAAAVGFTIAFAWKDYVLFQANEVIQKMAIIAPYFSRFFGALLVSLVGVVIIIVSSKVLR
jgi:hypothetical protein